MGETQPPESAPTGPTRRSWRFWLGYAAYCAFCVVAVMGVAELILRVGFGLPTGRFSNIVHIDPGQLLWPPSQRLEMDFGAVPYVVETNALGFRGEEVSAVKPPGVVRIAAVGDSITDGFFVDNDATFPHLLQEHLTSQGCRAEVINAGKGGASIDHEYAILSQKVIPLKPDLVLLTFYANDICELQPTPREKLLGVTEQPRPSTWKLTAYRTTLHSALAEFVMDGYFRARFETYRHRDRRRSDATGPERYDIPEGSDHQENVRIFRAAYSEQDGLCLNEPFSDEARRVIDNYLYVLRHFDHLCREHEARLVFVYFPAYPQVYAPDASSRIQEVLAEECGRLGVPWCDLTASFRRRGPEEVLYLAPVDFHPTPAGNRLIAETVGDFLLAEGLISSGDEHKMD